MHLSTPSSVVALAVSLCAFVAVIPIVTASPPDVTFLCNNIPEVCTNMCWAVRCANPTFPQDLTWDGTEGDSQVAKDRRASAGCVTGNNKCNKKNNKNPLYRGPGYHSCDEYPFATTSDSTYPDGHQVSRCVPPTENNSQGGSLSAVYKKWRKQGLTSHSLNINFGNPGSAGVNYCNNEPCNNDGYEIQDAAVSKRAEVLFRFYRTRSGIEIASLDAMEVGLKFERLLGEGESLQPGFLHDIMDDNIFIEDSIVEELEKPTMNGTIASSFTA